MRSASPAACCSVAACRARELSNRSREVCSEASTVAIDCAAAVTSSSRRRSSSSSCAPRSRLDLMCNCIRPAVTPDATFPLRRRRVALGIGQFGGCCVGSGGLLGDGCLESLNLTGDRGQFALPRDEPRGRRARTERERFVGPVRLAGERYEAMARLGDGQLRRPLERVDDPGAAEKAYRQGDKMGRRGHELIRRAAR